MGLYVKLIDGHGQYSALMRFVRMRDDKVILEVPNQTISWADPLAPIEIGVNFLGVPIEEEGMYEFQVFMDDVYVGRSSFVVKLSPPPITKGEF